MWRHDVHLDVNLVNKDKVAQDRAKFYSSGKIRKLSVSNVTTWTFLANQRAVSISDLEIEKTLIDAAREGSSSE